MNRQLFFGSAGTGLGDATFARFGTRARQSYPDFHTRPGFGDAYRGPGVADGQKWRVLQGAPEDLALDGSFSSVFSIGKVQFDAYTGQFQMNGMPTRKVILKADGLNRIWAEKALNRAGFSVADEAEIQLEFVENTWRLSYQQKQKKVLKTFMTYCRH